MSTDQEYWDACLIKTWRNDGRIGDAETMFNSMTDRYPKDVEGLLRTVPIKVPRKIRLRPYMAQHLEKISKRLWDQPPDKDVLLLRKLQTSNYTTTTTSTSRDLEFDREKQKLSTNRKRIAMNSLAKSNRNQATDWGVTKGGHIGRKR